MVTNTERIQANNDELREAIQMAENLPDAGSGGEVIEPIIEPLEATKNGTYTAPEGVDGYSPVSVNVPIPEGYIVPSGTKTITENGTHDAKAYESVSVAVPIPDGYIVPSGTLEVTENGTHDVTEYASVNVNVASGGGDGGALAGSIVDRTVTEFINDKATDIGDYALRVCTKLKTVDAPNATGIGDYAFAGCTALASVNLPLATTVGQYAFNQCNKVMSIVLPSAATVYTNAFRDCQYVETIDLGRNVTNIPAYTFYGCRGLKALVLRSPTVVTLANTNAFTTCYRILGTKNSGFNPNGEKCGFFYVPASLLEEYRNSTNWSSDNLVTQFLAIEGSEYDDWKDAPGKNYSCHVITSKSGNWSLTVYDNGGMLEVCVFLEHADIWWDDEGNETNTEFFNSYYNIVKDGNGYVTNLTAEFCDWTSYVQCISLSLDTSQLASTGKAYISAGCGNCENTVGVAEYLNAEIRFT